MAVEMFIQIHERVRSAGELSALIVIVRWLYCIHLAESHKSPLNVGQRLGGKLLQINRHRRKRNQSFHHVYNARPTSLADVTRFERKAEATCGWMALHCASTSVFAQKANFPFNRFFLCSVDIHSSVSVFKGKKV